MTKRILQVIHPLQRDYLTLWFIPNLARLVPISKTYPHRYAEDWDDCEIIVGDSYSLEGPKFRRVYNFDRCLKNNRYEVLPLLKHHGVEWRYHGGKGVRSIVNEFHAWFSEHAFDHEALNARREARAAKLALRGTFGRPVGRPKVYLDHSSPPALLARARDQDPPQVKRARNERELRSKPTLAEVKRALTKGGRCAGVYHIKNLNGSRTIRVPAFFTDEPALIYEGPVKPSEEQER